MSCEFCQWDGTSIPIPGADEQVLVFSSVCTHGMKPWERIRQAPGELCITPLSMAVTVLVQSIVEVANTMGPDWFPHARTFLWLTDRDAGQDFRNICGLQIKDPRTPKADMLWNPCPALPGGFHESQDVEIWRQSEAARLTEFLKGL